MSQPNPGYLDGLQAITALSVYCYNNLATYMCYDGDPGEEATVKEFMNSDTSPIGSDTRTGFRKGTLNLQYDLATDEAPLATKEMRPGFIVLFRGRYYVVGAVKPKVVKNDVIKFSVAVLELQNPFLSALLSTRGQQKVATINANVLATIAVTMLNNRVGTGSNVSFNVETYGTPGSAAPTGVTIAANGLLSINMAAGTADILVKATDTITGEDTHYGWGRYTVTAA